MAKAPILNLGLGIDFAGLDRDFGKVADRIERVGKTHSLKLGATVSDAASGKLDPEKMGAAVAEIGAQLSSGIASGVRASSGLMLGMGAHINKVLNQLAGSAITIFQRIDAAMKFPLFDTAMKSAQVKLTNFTKVIGRKPLSSLDLALEGGMGGIVQKVAQVAKVLFDQLAASLKGALEGVAAGVTGELKLVTAELTKVVATLTAAKAEAKSIPPIFAEMAAAAAKVAAPAAHPLAGPIPPRSKVPGTGRRIGFKTDFAPPAPVVPDAPLPAVARFAELQNAGVRAGAALKTAFGDAYAALQVLTPATFVGARAIVQFGAGLVSVPLRGAVAFGRLTNFLSSLGDVGKRTFHDLYEKHGIFVGGLMLGVKGVKALLTGLLRVGTLGAFGRHKKEADGAAQAVGNVGKAANKAGGEVKGLGVHVQALGGHVQNLGVQILAAFGVVGVIYSAVGFIKDGVKAASSLNETVSSSKVVFGDSFGVVQKQADAMSKKFGVVRKDQIDIASGFGAMAQSAGLTEPASADLANTMTKMAADLSSAKDLPFEEAGEKIRSALAGESKPLREYGVLLSEDAVKTYALAHGAAQMKGEVSEQAKITARAALVMQGLSYAQNDLERTSGSAANQFRKAGGGLKEFGERIGEALLPAVQTATESFNEFLAVLIEWSVSAGDTLKNWAGYVKLVFEGVGVLIRNFGDFWTIAKLRVGAFVANAIAYLETLGPNVVIIATYVLDNWQDLLTDLVSLTSTAFLNLLDNAKNFGKALWDAIQGKGFEFEFKPLLEGFKRVSKEFPELVKPDLVDVEAEVGGIMDRIAAKEADRAAKLQSFGAKQKPPGAVMEPAKAPEYKLASAVEIGSKEAYSAVVKNQAGGVKSTTGAVQGLHGTAKQQLQINKEQLAIMKQQKTPALAVK